MNASVMINYITYNEKIEGIVMCVAENKEIVLESVEQIVLTRQCNRIILALYNCKLSNKELAENMGISASSLSNSLQKIKNTGLDLLVIEQIGRNIYYSLSGLGHRYAKERLVNNQIINIQKKLTYSIQAEKALLEDMQESWGDEWKLKFDDLLLEYMNGENSQNDKLFQCFIKVVENIILEENWSKLKSLYALLGDEILERRIEKCFQQLLGIRHLCELENYEWKMAYKLIDDFYENSGEYIRREFLETFENKQFKSETINLIISALKKMREEALRKKMKKEEFYDEWESVFVSHERLLYYIAEKYNAQQ